MFSVGASFLSESIIFVNKQRVWDICEQGNLVLIHIWKVELSFEVFENVSLVDFLSTLFNQKTP